MKQIKIKTWKSKSPKRDEAGNIIGTEDVDEDLLVAINVLIANRRPEQMPKGLDNFRLFSRLSKAFEKAEKTKILQLEDGDYKFLKDIIEADVPASWGMNINLYNAFEEFLNAKEE